ncbi:hypothetical protein [Roseimaritima ulvae]|uniref:Uncharacterized protein n=1 Tax=Roseimaritima ulvae TaxID=980254 RepID=A0A5B9R5N8_9BACT|nr:hypothetical protein [Roseimaritima ulvae]QEG41543.1 hypothetical protein UC8_35670 [Roseimaritima ulvae]
MAVARDDSVVRGSLIATLILLVLSLALNFFLYRWGDQQSKAEKDKSDALGRANDSIAEMSGQIETLKKILGVEPMSDAEFESLATSTSGDADIDAIGERFVRDIGALGPNLDPANRNYPAIPTFMINSLRDRNVQNDQLNDERKRIDAQAKSDVAIAEKATADAKADTKKMENTLNERIAEFDAARADMKQKNAEIADSLTNLDRQFNLARKQSQKEIGELKQEITAKKELIDIQKRRINELQQTEFEIAQGTVTSVINKLIQIDLGSADQLRRGVVFSVIDADATRVTDAEPKAKIEVISIRKDHLSLCRVIDAPALSDPIIPGDKIYSPFWAPGRTVKIALAGEIDIDNDGRGDTETLRGMIMAAGGQVVEPEELDPSVRFLVVGETPEIEPGAEAEVREQFTNLGIIRSRARELGITEIPAWKLLNYIQVISDAKTTPLGSAARGEDFKPLAPAGTNRRLPSDVSDLYRD